VLPARFVTEIEVDAADATGNTAIASFSGFNASTPATPGHVFRTINGLGGSATWTNLSGDLPDIPVNSLAIDPTKVPHVLYAGTDIGVFQSVNDGANWLYLTNGHPNVSVFGLDRNPGTSQIISSTHGRGMFELIDNGFPASFFTMSPCRVADTRNAPGPSGGPALAANSTRTFPVTGLCGVPGSATAVAVNMAVILPTDVGDLHRKGQQCHRPARRRRPDHHPERHAARQSRHHRPDHRRLRVLPAMNRQLGYIRE
jgi:hypothetical protein